MTIKFKEPVTERELVLLLEEAYKRLSSRLVREFWIEGDTTDPRLRVKKLNAMDDLMVGIRALKAVHACG